MEHQFEPCLTWFNNSAALLQIHFKDFFGLLDISIEAVQSNNIFWGAAKRIDPKIAFKTTFKPMQIGQNPPN